MSKSCIISSSIISNVINIYSIFSEPIAISLVEMDIFWSSTLSSFNYFDLIYFFSIACCLINVLIFWNYNSIWVHDTSSYLYWPYKNDSKLIPYFIPNHVMKYLNPNISPVNYSFCNTRFSSKSSIKPFVTKITPLSSWFLLWTILLYYIEWLNFN